MQEVRGWNSKICLQMYIKKLNTGMNCSMNRPYGQDAEIMGKNL